MSAISSPRIARVVGRCSLEASVLSNGTVVVAVPRAGPAARLLTAVLLAQSFVWVLEAGVGPTFDELRAGLEALLLDDREQGYSRVLARRYWQATDGRWHRSSEPEAGTTVLVRAWTKLDVAAASPCRYPAGLVPHADLDAFPEQWSGALQAAAVACARSAAHEPALCAGATLCGPHACSRCCCITPLPLAVPSSSWCEISCPRAGACCRKARASCSKRAAYSTAAARIRAQTSPLHGVPARPTSVSRPRFDAASLDRLRATAPGYIYA